MKCSSVRTLLSKINDRDLPIPPVPPADLELLVSGGYVLRTTKDDYDKGLQEVGRLSDMVSQLDKERSEKEQADVAVQRDEDEEHSFLFRFKGEEEKDAVRGRIQKDTADATREASELAEMEANVNQLIQEKSTIDRMVPYDGGYLSLTGVGAVILNDLSVRDYRVSDYEFPQFLAEIRATYAELRGIADKAAWYAGLLKANVPVMEEVAAETIEDEEELPHVKAEADSMLWGTAIGLGKLQGDPNQVGVRFVSAYNGMSKEDSTFASKLAAAEIMTASGGDLQGLTAALADLDRQVRRHDVPKDQSPEVAATLLAGRRFDGTYPVDRFSQFKAMTDSNDAASLLAVMNVPVPELSAKFRSFNSLFLAWGYMKSEDTEVASAFLAMGELGVDEVDDKLKHIVEQLKNYLQYPLIASAILASIPVFESHEALDLMEKAVTLLYGYTQGLERADLTALAVRMIHGVRNELVREIDPTAPAPATPVQFTYGSNPRFFAWYYPVIIAHSSYHSTFASMGGFHPGHSHGVGGFAG